MHSAYISEPGEGYDAPLGTSEGVTVKSAARLPGLTTKTPARSIITDFYCLFDSEQPEPLILDVECETELLEKFYLEGRVNHGDDSGVDLCVPRRHSFQPGQADMLDLGVRCKLHERGSDAPMPFMIVPRSSMGKNTPLRLSNSIGVIDAGYSGKLQLMLDNNSSKNFAVTSGTRLCQVVSADMRPILLNVVDSIVNPSSRRGQGVGSTGQGVPAAPAPWEPPTFSVAETSRAFRRAPVLERAGEEGAQGPHRAKIAEGWPPFNAMLDRVAAVGVEDVTSYGGRSVTQWHGSQEAEGPAAVARPVPMKETQWNEKAKAAMDKEWNRLKSIKTWLEDTVISRKEAEKQARRSGATYHFGRVFPILVEKNSELDETDERRKFKGRVVFAGSDVRDQDKNIALFQELSSSPATMEAGRAADAYGMLPGHTIQQADAVQAYTQATLKGTKTYVSLPKEAWPDWWHDLPYDDPVCVNSGSPYMGIRTAGVFGRITVTTYSSISALRKLLAGEAAISIRCIAPS